MPPYLASLCFTYFCTPKKIIFGYATVPIVSDTEYIIFGIIFLNIVTVNGRIIATAVDRINDIYWLGTHTSQLTSLQRGVLGNGHLLTDNALLWTKHPSGTYYPHSSPIIRCLVNMAESVNRRPGL